MMRFFDLLLGDDLAIGDGEHFVIRRHAKVAAQVMPVFRYGCD
jgi:hypothetical protein